MSFAILAAPFFAFAQTETENFPDVPQTHKNSYAIQVLKDAGIVSGFGDGNFQPDQEITRAESTAIILKAASIPAEESVVRLPFTDIPETAWYYRVIQKGYLIRKLKGYEDNTFRPENPVTVPEALALLLGFFDINTNALKIDPIIYGGLNREDWYASRCQYAKNNNLIEPNERGYVDPAAPLTRAELAEIIYRFKTNRQTGKAFDITSGWITTEHLDNFWRIRHPPEWQIFKGVFNSVIWKRTENHAFFTRVWPNTAHLSISLVENSENLSAAQYFAQIKTIYTDNYPDSAPVFSNLVLGSRTGLKIEIPEKQIMDMALQLPNHQFLVMYGQYGASPLGEFLKKQLELILMSYEYVERPPVPPVPVIPLEERMETLRENILVEGAWNETADLFPDKRLIHTDAIGIGTGPVDYYFSPEASTTIKLERDSATILNIQEGETTSF